MLNNDYLINNEYWKNLMAHAELLPILPSIATEGNAEYAEVTSSLSNVDQIETITNNDDVLKLAFLSALCNIFLHRCLAMEKTTYFIHTAEGGTLPVSHEITGEMTVKDLLEDVLETITLTLDHSDFPLSEIMDMQNGSNTGDVNPVNAILAVESPPSNTINDTCALQILLREGRLIIRYDTTRYALHIVTALSHSLTYLFENIKAILSCEIRDVALMQEKIKGHIIARNTGQPIDMDNMTYRSFMNDVFDRYAHNYAVTDGKSAYTYQSLKDYTTVCRNYLAANNVAQNDVVIVNTTRSCSYILLIMGILQHGATFVPISPTIPDKRYRAIREELKPKLIIYDDDAASINKDIPGAVHYSAVLNAPLSGNPTTNDSMNDEDFTAYIIYTSGSTGNPKGVAISASNLLSSTLARLNYYNYHEQNHLLLSSITFDSSLAVIFGSLMSGGTLYLPEDGVEKDSNKIVDILKQAEIENTLLLPSLYQVIIENPAFTDVKSLKRVILAGEKVHASLIDNALKLDKTIDYYNEYGPTENTIWATVHKIAGDKDIPIGKAIDNVHVHVMDQYMNLLPNGFSGEIYIGGRNLSGNYVNQPDLTKQRYLTDTTQNQPGALLYKTGDIGYYDANGLLRIKGRCDRQIKLRGFRIELGEIEEILQGFDMVKQAFVIARNSTLIAFIIPAHEDRKPDMDQITNELKTRVPEYMIPSQIHFINKITQLPNGKPDYKSLEAIVAKKEEVRTIVLPETELEKRLLEIWQNILSIKKISITDNFFEVGENSLKAAMLINRIQKEIKAVIYVNALFKNPTIREFAAYLTTNYKEEVDAFLEITHSGIEKKIETLTVDDVTTFTETMRKKHSSPVSAAASGKKLDKAVFILSPPRSGTTLLRVILSGNRHLFSPPELELLHYQTMGERKEILLRENKAFYLEGAIRAIMELRQCSEQEARQIVDEFTVRNADISSFFQYLQEQMGERLLVDKTASYSLSLDSLQNAEQIFENAVYIHLIRNPYAMINSFVEARLDQAFIEHDRYSKNQLGELIWSVSHQNITSFLENIPEHRKTRVKFEDMVKNPADVSRSLCDFLSIPYDETMVDVYNNDKGRMTDGINKNTKMLGDYKLKSHAKIKASIADKWRANTCVKHLSENTYKYANLFGYSRDIEPNQCRLSHSQNRMWFFHKLSRGDTAYNIPIRINLSGPFNHSHLKDALTILIDRHHLLRSNIVEEKGIPSIKVRELINPRITTTDVCNLDKNGTEKVITRIIEEEKAHTWDFEQEQLFRITLITSPDETVLICNIHHIFFDGWSFSILVNELIEIYQSLEKGTPLYLPVLEKNFSDYVAWEQGLDYETLIADWTALYGTRFIPAEFPHKDEPMHVSEPDSKLVKFTLDDINTDLVERFIRDHKVTPFVFFLTIFQFVLAHYTQGDEPGFIAFPTANRTSEDFQEIIGCFINIVLFKSGIDPQKTLLENLTGISEAFKQTYQFQDIPLDRLLKNLEIEGSNHMVNPIKTSFSFQNFQIGETIDDNKKIKLTPLVSTNTKFNLSMQISQMDRTFEGAVLYDANRYDAHLIENVITLYRSYLSQLVMNGEKKPGNTAPIGEYDDVSIIHGPQIPRTGKTVIERFDALAVEHPDAIAINSVNHQVTYGDLKQLSDKMAVYLHEQGIGRGDRVVLYMTKSIEYFICSLAVHKCNAVYISVDHSTPIARLDYIAGHTGASLIITNDEHIKVPDMSRLITFNHEMIAALPCKPFTPDYMKTSLDDTAYIVFTSGTSGYPKGVEIPHRALNNLIEWFIIEQKNYERANTAVFTNLNFDPIIFEVWGYLLLRLTIHIPDSSIASIDSMIEFINRKHITVLFLPTSRAQSLLSAQITKPLALKRLLIGGEQLNLRSLLTTIEIINMYGPAETCVLVTHSHLDRENTAQKVPIGKPIDNTSIYILDDDLQPVPKGETGEIYISGLSVGKGYINDESITRTHFLPDPFTGDQDMTMYKSGDLGILRPDGNIEFAGRKDGQVKINSIRIELADINFHLCALPGIQNACVINTSKDTPFLTAYIVKEKEDLTINDIREHLKDRLPVYMIPHDFIFTDVIPLTPNGKTDVRVLQEHYENMQESKSMSQQASAKQVILTLAREILENDGVTIDDDYFKVGGDSINAITFINRINEELGLDLSLMQIFNTSKLSDFSDILGDLTSRQSPENTPVAIPDEQLPPSLLQINLWHMCTREKTNHYNNPLLFKIDGTIERDLLEQSMEYIVTKHDILRSYFPLENSAVMIKTADELNIPVYITEVALNNASEEQIIEYINKEADYRFDLDTAPLWKMTLIKVSDTAYYLFFLVHHLIFDGWSTDVFLNELISRYDALRTKRAPSIIKPKSYFDYIRWEQAYLAGDAYQNDLAWWKNKLTNAKTAIFRNTKRSYTAAGKYLDLPVNDHKHDMKSLCDLFEVSNYAFLFTIYIVMLHKLYDKTDIIIGVPFSGRNRGKFLDYIGMYVNLLPIRTIVDPDQSFASLVKSVWNNTVEVMERQNVPLQEIIGSLEHELKDAFELHSVFIYQNIELKTHNANNFSIKPIDSRFKIAKFFLSIGFVEYGESLSGIFNYNDDFFTTEEVLNIKTTFFNILQNVILKPDNLIKDISILPTVNTTEINESIIDLTF